MGKRVVGGGPGASGGSGGSGGVGAPAAAVCTCGSDALSVQIKLHAVHNVLQARSSWQASARGAG